MFNDEEPFAFKKMHEFSTVDGFLEITESLGEMIKYVANEPSVGLFYVQQHTQSTVPNLINLKNKIAEKSHEMSLHTEDSEDSINMVRSMKECGFPVADDMIKEINKSLAIMSTRQPKRGLIHSPSSGFRMSSNSGPPSTRGGNAGPEQNHARTTSYLSNVFRSAKQKASKIRWPQLESEESIQDKDERFLSYPKSGQSKEAPSTSSTTPEAENEELPLSCQIADELQEELQIDGSISHHELLSLSEKYEEFKADREAKLEEWLQGKSNQDGHVEKVHEVKL